jgi:hypothetical protein
MTLSKMMLRSLLGPIVPPPTLGACYDAEPRGNQPMGNVSVIVKQLRKERDKVEKQLSGLNAALAAFVGTYYGAKPTRKKRTMSAAGRKKIAAAQRARWAKIRAKKVA